MKEFLQKKYPFLIEELNSLYATITDYNEWKIAIEFAQQLENDNLKKAYIDGAVNIHNNMVQENISVFDENILLEKLQSFIKNKANLN